MRIKRKIVHIDEARCDGCGLCANACAEGAIAIVDGKARLVSETYCDGLGACLGECPRGAIAIVEQEAEAFDGEAVERHLKTPPRASARGGADGEGACRPGAASAASAPAGGGCPGARAFSLPRAEAAAGRMAASAPPSDAMPASELAQWPVQLALVPAHADYWTGADVLLAADCAAFACGAFHARLLRGRKLVIACPKLDDLSPHVDKLAAILAADGVRSATVARMEVPCCGGLVSFAKAAVAKCGKGIPVAVEVVGIDGRIEKEAAAPPAQ